MLLGRRHIILILLCLPAIIFSQSTKLEKALLKRFEVKREILLLQDSLKRIENEISNLQSLEFESFLQKTDEIYIYNCRPTTKLRKTAWPSSEVIKEFDQFVNVILLGFEDDYLKVNTPYGIGYVHRTYAVQGRRKNSRDNNESNLNSNSLFSRDKIFYKFNQIQIYHNKTLKKIYKNKKVYKRSKRRLLLHKLQW